MKTTLHPVRLLVVAAALLVTACQDLPGPTEPLADPALNARADAPRQHGVQDLAAWFRASAPEVMALPNTVFADHDETNNVLVFGIADANAMFGVQNALERRGVPATAYQVRVVEPIHFASTTLRTAHRPTKGGIQIHWSQYVCTLGFNVDHAGGRSFITNSHCTNKQGTTGTAVLPADQQRRLKPDRYEAHDPAYGNLPGCSAGKKCRYSDAARALYVSSTESSRGVIAKTTGENSGSLDVSGSFTVTTQDNSTTSFALGTTMNKVGRTTGWTSGTVSSSCATVNVSGSNIQLHCQTLVQNSSATIVQGGDSGSPVFKTGSGDNVELVGILWGGNTSGSLFVFSPLKNIQDELGGLTATADGSGGGNGGGGGGGGDCVPRGPSGNNCK
jgi:hypothetical protein